MRFRGLKPKIGLPILLVVGIVLVIYGIIRSDATGIIFGVTCAILSIVMYATTRRDNREDTHI